MNRREAWRSVAGLVSLIGLALAGCQTQPSGTDGTSEPEPAAAYEAPRDSRGAGTARFVDGPVAQAAGPGVRIAFRVSAPTDVAVAVLGPDGAVVRHLAAGLLGPQAPEPFLKNSLTQGVEWDGRDDAGRPVAGPVKVRVRLGLRPVLDRSLGADENRLGVIRGLGVGAGGEVFVLHGGAELRVLDREGRYRRTIMPYPAGTPAARTASIGHLTVEGERLPIVFNGMGKTTYPLTMSMKKQTMAWSSKGYLVAVSSPGTATEHGPPQHLLAFHPEGGAPDKVPFVGPWLRWPKGLVYGEGDWGDPRFEHLAASPDGEWIYYVPATYDNRHGVFRLRWGEDKDAGMEEAFLGEHYRPGSDDKHFNDPQGLAVDGQGRIYVCDRGNNRVMIFAADGGFLGKFAVAAPKLIAVPPDGGAIYVVSRPALFSGPAKDKAPLSSEEYRQWKAREAARAAKRSKPEPTRLTKFTGWGAELPRETAQVEIPAEILVLDPGASPPKLWASVGDRLTPVFDRGQTLEIGAPVNPEGGLPSPGYVVADPARNRVLVANGRKYESVDLTSGKREDFVAGVEELARAPDGTFVGMRGDGLVRFDAEGKRLAFPGGSTNAAPIGPCARFRGLAVGPGGDIYLLRVAQEKGIQSRLDVFGPDGKLQRAALVDGLGIGDCGLAVDRAGNIYLGANVKPRSRVYPPEFQGKVPLANWVGWETSLATWNNEEVCYRARPWFYPMKNEYLYHLGALFKFGPSGGAFYGRSGYHDMLPGQAGKDLSPLAYADHAPAGATDYRSGYLIQRVKATGVQWRFAGLSIVPTSERLWGDPGCVCHMSRLAVDEYGRVFAPDCFQFGVHVLDGQGNRILRVGRYGNADDGVHGPDASRSDIRNPKSEIFFAWPSYVSAAGDRLFVSDPVNRRVSVIRLEGEQEAVVEVK